MIAMRIEEKPAFTIVGRKTWISFEEGSEAFGRFWEQCRQEGLFEILAAHGSRPGPVTNGMVLGVSCVEKDPAERSFFFYVGVEYEGTMPRDELQERGLEGRVVPASTWAIFRNQGTMPDSLVASEMHAFGEWLPHSPYVHAHVPELEVYPPGEVADGEMLTEFWLPIRAKDG